MTQYSGFMITGDTFDDAKIKLIEQLPSGDQTIVIYLKIISLACKSNAGGFLMINKHIPFNDESIAALIGRSLQVVRYALTTLIQFGMIEETEEGFKVADFQRWLPPQDTQRIEENERIAEARKTKGTKQIEPPKEIKEKKKKRVFEEGSIELSLSQLLHSQMLINNPEMRKPNLQSWAEDFRKMIDIDKRKPEQIRNMIMWSQQHDFWSTNILSGKKLREKYDQLRVVALKETESGKYRIQNRQTEADDIFNRMLNGGGTNNTNGGLIE